MTSLTVISNPSLKRIKKHKMQNQIDITSWKSETQRNLYRSKLLQALQHVRLGSSGSVNSARLHSRAVRETANRVLAQTAKGRSRWSRAILANQFKRKCVNRNLRRRLTKQRIGGLRLKTTSWLPAVQRKARDLRRLVPGCRKQPLCVVLEEVMDYVSALDMQVKVMAAVVDRFAQRSSSGSGIVAGGGSR